MQIEREHKINNLILLTIIWMVHGAYQCCFCYVRIIIMSNQLLRLCQWIRLIDEES